MDFSRSADCSERCAALARDSACRPPIARRERRGGWQTMKPKWIHYGDWNYRGGPGGSAGAAARIARLERSSDHSAPPPRPPGTEAPLSPSDPVCISTAPGVLIVKPLRGHAPRSGARSDHGCRVRHRSRRPRRPGERHANERSGAARFTAPHLVIDERPRNTALGPRRTTVSSIERMARTSWSPTAVTMRLKANLGERSFPQAEHALQLRLSARRASLIGNAPRRRASSCARSDRPKWPSISARSSSISWCRGPCRDSRPFKLLRRESTARRPGCGHGSGSTRDKRVERERRGAILSSSPARPPAGSSSCIRA